MSQVVLRVQFNKCHGSGVYLPPGGTRSRVAQGNVNCILSGVEQFLPAIFQCWGTLNVEQLASGVYNNLDRFFSQDESPTSNSGRCSSIALGTNSP